MFFQPREVYLTAVIQRNDGRQTAPENFIV